MKSQGLRKKRKSPRARAEEPKLRADDSGARFKPRARSMTPQSGPGPSGEGAVRERRAQRAAAAQKAEPVRHKTAAPPPLIAPPERTHAFALPVRTALTPRPELSVPTISVANVDWEDVTDAQALSPLSIWSRCERELGRRLKELGATGAQGRFDLREARFVFRDESDMALVEARAHVVATLTQPSLVMTMGWVDPVLAPLSVPGIEGFADELKFEHDEAARDHAATVAVAGGADFVYRIVAPNMDYFIALRALKAAANHQLVTPGTPVGHVLRGLSELRGALASRRLTTDVLRVQFTQFSKGLNDRTETGFRDTEWTPRLVRSARVVAGLALRLSPPTFTAIAAGKQAEEYPASDVAVELSDALRLLEDEWGAFA